MTDENNGVVEQLRRQKPRTALRDITNIPSATSRKAPAANKSVCSAPQVRKAKATPLVRKLLPSSPSDGLYPEPEPDTADSDEEVYIPRNYHTRPILRPQTSPGRMLKEEPAGNHKHYNTPSGDVCQLRRELSTSSSPSAESKRIVYSRKRSGDDRFRYSLTGSQNAFPVKNLQNPLPETKGRDSIFDRKPKTHPHGKIWVRDNNRLRPFR